MQPDSIDPSQTSISSTVDNERIEELPVQSRKLPELYAACSRFLGFNAASRESVARVVAG
jgi:hypothetical protein